MTYVYKSSLFFKEVPDSQKSFVIGQSIGRRSIFDSLLQDIESCLSTQLERIS